MGAPRCTGEQLRPRRFGALALSMALALGMVGMGAHAQQTEALSLNLPAQSLGDALLQLGEQAQLQIFYLPEIVAGRQAPALSGQLTPDQALARLLAGTGITFSRQGRSVTLIRGEGAVRLQEVSVSATASLDPVTEATASYAARGASILKGAQSLREIPQSISVVTRQRMDDQNLSTVEQVMAQSVGISKGIAGLGQHSYSSRGFNVASMQVDGLGSFSAGMTLGAASDLGMYDRVEVLRGAAGLLVGNGTPGGAVNFVRKRPLAEQQINLSLQAGSWRNYKAEVDATGPLNESGSLRGRIVVSYQDRNFFYKKTHADQPFLYGVLEYDATPDTRLTAGVRYQRYQRDGADWTNGLPGATDGADLRLPRSTSFGPSWGETDIETHEFFVEATHDFNARWRGRFAASHEQITWDAFNAYRNGNVDPVTLQGASLVPYLIDVDRKSTSFDASVTGHFDLLGREHKVVLGANRYDTTNHENGWSDWSNTWPIDFSDPYQSTWTRPQAGTRTPVALKQLSEGLYGNLHFQLADPLKLVLGGRLSWYDYSLRVNHGASVTRYKQTQEFTPYAGLLYDLNPAWTAYASYADIFEPQSNRFDAAGKPLDPAIGSNYEIGVKGDLLGGRLNTSLALFYIRQDNRALIDPDHPTTCPSAPIATSPCYINAGEVESKGFDAEINGQLAQGLQAWAGYTYNRQIYLKDRDRSGHATANEGRQFSADTPKHIVHAGLSQRLPGALNPWTLGGSVNVRSRTGYTSGGVWREQRGYAVWHAFARYQIDDHWGVSLNLNNVFDRVYYQSAGKSLYGDPRNVMLTLRGQF